MSRMIYSVLIAALVAVSTLAIAEEKQVSQADYQAAIEKFGVSSVAARTAAEQAMLSIPSEETLESDFLVHLPDDFLEGSPY